MLSFLARLITRIRYGKVYPPVSSWQRAGPEEHFIVTLPPLPPRERVNYSTGVWTAMYLNQHPHLKDTRPVTGEETDRYKTLPKWMK